MKSFSHGRMSRVEILEYYKLELHQLFFTRSDSRIFEIGILLVIGAVLSLLCVQKKKLSQEIQNHTIFFVILGLICSFMTLKIFPYEKLPEILCMIQFSFRLLEFIGFFLAFSAAVGFSFIMKKFTKVDVIVLSLIAFLLLLPMNRLIRYEDSGWREEMLWPAVSVNENTGRVHAGCASFEYLPTKAFQNLDYLKKRENRTYILEGKADLGEVKDGTNLELYLTPDSSEVTLELPYLYYLGYEANLIDEVSGKKEKITLKESEKGFLSCHMQGLEEGKTYQVNVSYTGTNGMKISFIISLITMSILIIIFFYKRSKTIQEKKAKKLTK